MKLSRKLLLTLTLVVGLMGCMVNLASAQVLEEDESSYIPESGFFFSLEYGPYFLLPTSEQTGNLSPNVAGSFGGVQLGYLINKRFSLQFHFLTTQIGGSGQFGGANSSYIFNLSFAIHFANVNRLFFYFKAGGGLQLTLPELPNSSMLGFGAHGGLGLRYYTRLKHLSLGLELLAVIRLPFPAPTTLSFGLGLMPTLMYIF